MIRTIRPQTLTEVLATTYQERQQIWGAITRHSCTLLYGSTGVGKSFFTLGLLLCIATGERWLEHTPNGAHNSLLLDGEMDMHTQSKRIKQLIDPAFFSSVNQIGFLTRESFGVGLVPNISNTKAQAIYDGLFANYHLIVIDNMNTTSYPLTDRDTEIQQFQRVMPWLLKMRDNGKAVILVHHTNKQGQQMGSILKEQISDNVIELEKIQNDSPNLKFRVKFHKHRHHSSIKPFDVELVLSSHGAKWLTVDSNREIEAQIEDMLRAKIPHSQIESSLKVDMWKIAKVKKAISQGDANDIW